MPCRAKQFYRTSGIYMRIQTRAPSTISSCVCVVILSESRQNLSTCLPFEVLVTNSYQIPNVRPLDRKPRHTFFLHALIKPRGWEQRDRPPSSPWICFGSSGSRSCAVPDRKVLGPERNRAFLDMS